MQMAGPPWDGYGENVRVGSDWTKVAIAFRFLSKTTPTLEAGRAQITMGFGFGPQVIEIADCVLDFGRTRSRRNCRYGLTYNGRGAGRRMAYGGARTHRQDSQG